MFILLPEHVKKYHPNDENSTENHPNLTTTTSTTTVKTENINLTNNTIVTSTTENIKSELELKLHESASTGIITSSTTALVNTNFPNKTISRVTGTNQHVQTCLLTSSPFNTVSPPNKTVSDTYDAMNLDEGQFDEALILAAANASEEDITNLVTPLLS